MNKLNQQENETQICPSGMIRRQNDFADGTTGEQPPTTRIICFCFSARWESHGNLAPSVGVGACPTLHSCPATGFLATAMAANHCTPPNALF